jgi:ketosteroid isomerase-like protein
MADKQPLEPMLHQEPPEDDLGVKDFLDRFAEAFTSGDGEAVATLWDTPAFVLSADMARPVNEASEVAEFFGGSREQYNEIGITGTRAEIVRLDEISDHLVMVRVRWPYLDNSGNEMGAETSTYTLARKGDGGWKIRISVMHGAEAVN